MTLIKKRLVGLLGSLLSMMVLLGCGQPSALSHSDIRLNELRVIGSHNSYKKALLPEAKALLEAQLPERAFALDYAHENIASQLDLGLRHLELDVLLDPEGGRFVHPFVQTMRAQPMYQDDTLMAMNQPGLKVMHVPDIDVASHCVTFALCLAEVSAWSQANPNHLPLFILLNVKESGTKLKLTQRTEVLGFGEADYQLIDRALVLGLGDSLLTPDDVRGDISSLAEAVRTKGWPLLSEVRGKVIVIFDGNERQRNLYRLKHPSLRNRAMFASYEHGEQEAAIMVLNNPSEQMALIQRRVQQGYIVRTRSDSGNRDALRRNTKRRDDALTSGAQIISTDLYPTSPQVSKFGWSVSFAGGALSMCGTAQTQCE